MVRIVKELLHAIWPSKSQYQQWSMPNKLTFIGTYVGLISVAITTATLTIATVTKMTIDEALIKGQWNRDKAEKIVLELMRNYDWHGKHEELCDDPDGCAMKHEIIDHYYLKYASNDAMIVIGYSRDEEYSCHSCTVNLSVFEFNRGPKGWDINASYIDAFEGGSWGDPPNKINIISIGYDIFGIVIEHAYMTVGIGWSYTSIYSPVADKLEEVFKRYTGSGPKHECVILDDKKNVIADVYRDEWWSKITIRPHGTSFYDLYVEEFGETCEENKSIVYRYDGRKYIASDVYQ